MAQQRNQQQGGPGFATDYIEVAERVSKFYELHPNGRIRSDEPTVIVVADKVFIGVHSYVYRDDDPESAIAGEASSWEPFPGQTNFTRNSEAENAETSAIGRALAAAGIETKRSIASATEVRNRQAEKDQPPPEPVDDGAWRAAILGACEKEGLDVDAVCQRASRGGRHSLDSFDHQEVPQLRAAFKALCAERENAADGEGDGKADAPPHEQVPADGPPTSAGPATTNGGTSTSTRRSS